MKVTDDLQIIFIFSNDDDQSLEDGLDRRRKKTERPSSVNSPATLPFKCLDILHTSPIPKGGEFDQGLITWLILHQRPQYTPYRSLKNLNLQILSIFCKCCPSLCPRCTEYNGDNKFLNNSVLENNSIFGIGY